MNNILNSIVSLFTELKDEFIFCFIDGDRWKWLADGLLVTLQVTLYSVLLGILIGVVIAIIRSTYDTNSSSITNPVGKAVLKILNAAAKVYLTVIRGTPVVVQLMLIYYVILVSVDSKIVVASLAFGINSGAYVAEIVRSGIMSIDKGQFEAGRSRGLSYTQTMIQIIIPQAFKNVLPTLANEFIVLLKETSVSGYVALEDITKAGDLIRSRTYSAFMPLIAVAIIYLVLVMFFTKLVSILERRLRDSDH
ncbi:MAG: amino acid ABC transporter permease [Clostridia bacterium]|nr:amino acid ABC transporter permease [Clostridia bacterium]